MKSDASSKTEILDTMRCGEKNGSHLSLLQKKLYRAQEGGSSISINTDTADILKQND